MSLFSVRSISCASRVVLLALLLVVGFSGAAQAAPPVLASLSPDRAFDPEVEGGVSFTVSFDQPVNAVATIEEADGTVVRSVLDGQSFPAGPGGLGWDGRDDGGAFVADGEYLWKVTATNVSGERGSVAGKIGVDTREVAAITTPSPDDRVSGTIDVQITPAAGRTLSAVSLSTSGCRTSSNCGVGAPEQAADGTWSVPVDTVALHDVQTSLWATVQYSDRYGWLHSRAIETVEIDVANPLAVGGPADVDFSPDGNGSEDTWRQLIWWSHAPTTVSTLDIRNASGTLVRSLGFDWTTDSYGQLQSWDGLDSSGVDAPPGSYTWEISVTGKAGDVVLVKGKVGIERGRSITITSPVPDALLGSTAQLAARPDAGRQFSRVSFWLSPCNADCGVDAVRQDDGTWTAELTPAYYPYDARVTVSTYGYWTDRFGVEHGVGGSVAARWDRPADPFVAGLSGTGRAFSPDGDGYEDTLPLSWSVSRAATATVLVRNASGQVVRTLAQSGPASDSVSWDGLDDDARPLPRGQYDVTVEATDGSDTATASGSLLIDSRTPATLGAPAAGATVGDTAKFVVTRANPDVSLTGLRVGWVGDCGVGYWWSWWSCDSAIDDSPEAAGPLETTFDTTEIPDRDASIQYEITWLDALGGGHSRFAIRELQIAGTSSVQAPGESVAFTPDGDGADDTVAIPYVAGRSGGLKLEVLGAGNTVVRTIAPQVVTRGSGSLSWDGFDDDGTTVAAGTYRARLTLAPGSGTSSTATGQAITVVRPTPGLFDAPQKDDTLAGVERIEFRPSPDLPAPSTVDIQIDGSRVASIYAPSADGVWRTAVSTIGWDGTRTLTAAFGYTDALGAGRTARTSVPVVVDNSGPPFTFVADPPKGVAPFDTSLKVAFGRPATGWSYRVRFGDGTDPVTAAVPDGSTTLELAHRYGRSGSYRASVELVEGMHRAQRSIAIAVTRPPNRAPVATLDVTPKQGAAPLDVSAAITATDPDEDAQVSATVDWGDGVRSTVPATTPEALGRSLTHRYARAGSFLIRLQVSDSRLAAVKQQRVTVVLPEPLAAVAGDDVASVAGRSVTFDASGSRPGALIDAYTWDFGDGTSGAGDRTSHVYAAAGNYTATLTVRSGTTTTVDTVTVRIDPAPTPPSGGGGGAPGATAGLQVRVKTPGGADVAGATVTYIGGTGKRVSATTGSDGRATLVPLPDGNHAIYAYAQGYIPDRRTATIVGGNGTLAMTLAPGDVVESSTSSRELTRQEIIDAGIDLSDPANQFSVKFEIHLNFDPKQPDVVYGGIASGDGRLVRVGGGGGGSGGPGGGSPNCFATGCSWPDGTSVSLEGEPGKQYLNWLIIPGRYWQLKQFFEVKTVVQNLAPQPFTLENGAARIALPAGLSLAPTATPQSPELALPVIPAGGSQKATWIVRGDAVGEYRPTVDVSATLEPVGEPVSSRSILKDPIVVEGASRLKVVVQAENRTYEGKPYRVRVGVRNDGRSTVNNPGLELLPGGTGYLYEPRMLTGASTDELAPGQTLWADEYTLVPRADSVDELNLKKSFIATEAGDRSEPGDIVRFASSASVQRAPTAGAGAVAPGKVARGTRLAFTPTVPDAAHAEAVLGYEIYATPDLDTPFENDPIRASFDREGDQVVAKLDPSDTPTTTHWFAVSTRVRRKGLDGVTRERNVLRHDLVKYTPVPATDPKVVVSNAGKFEGCDSDPSRRPRTLSLTVTDRFAAITSVTVQVGPFQKQVYTAPGGLSRWNLDVDVEGKILDGGVTLRAAATDADGVIGPELITPLCNGVAPPPPIAETPTPAPTPAGSEPPPAQATPAAAGATPDGEKTAGEALAADGLAAPEKDPVCAKGSAEVFGVSIKAPCITEKNGMISVPLEVGGDRLRIAGLDLLPVSGTTTIAFDLNKGTVSSTAPVLIKIGSIPIVEKKLSGELNLKSKSGGKSLLELVPGAAAKLHGLPITSPSLSIALEKDALSVDASVGFKVPISKKPVTGEATLKATMEDGLQIENVEVRGEGLSLGGKLSVGRFALRVGKVAPAPGSTAERLGWTGAATVVMPFGSGNAALQLGGRLRVVDTVLDQIDVAAGAESLNKPLGTTGIFLQKVGLDIGVRDAGATFFIGGELGATLGPQVFGKSAVRVEGGLTYFINVGAADAIRVNGAISVVSAQIGGGQLTIVPEDGLIDFGGVLKLDAGLKIEGEMFGWVESTRRFNVSGEAKVEIPHVSIANTTVEANLSDRGATACVRKFGLDVGASYRWAAGGKLELYDGLFGNSCDIGRYRSLPDAAAFVAAKAVRASRQTPLSRTASVTVPVGTKVAAVELRGVGGAPRVRVTSPDGHTAETSAVGTTTDRFISAEDPERGITSLALGGPKVVGTWTFAPVDGSVAIAAVRRAEELPEPKVTASVSRAAGGRQLLRWSLVRAPGQKVTFAIKGATGTKSLFTVAGGAGRKAIDALSSSGRQQIVALVEQDGRPRDTRVLASFAPSKAAPAAPRPVTLRRAGGKLQIAWREVPGAQGYVVDVELSDGRHLLLPAKARSGRLSVGRVGKDVGVTVKVRATGRGGRTSQAATGRLKGTSKKR